MEKIVSKNVTHKTGGPDPRDVKKDSPPLFMCRLTGVLESVKSFEDRTGTMKTVFVGDFFATGADGKLYQSEKMYVFKQLEEKLAGAWKSGGELAQEFSYDVFALFDEKSATRYVYQARPCVPTATNDRLAHLMEKVNAVPLPTVSAEAGKMAEEAKAKGTKK